MAWKAGARSRNGWYKSPLAGTKWGYSGSMHSISGVSLFGERSGNPSNTYPPGRLNSDAAYGACITAILKYITKAADFDSGGLFYIGVELCHPYTKSRDTATTKQGKVI